MIPKGTVGSNPTFSVREGERSYFHKKFDPGEVPKLAEGTPLERVQVVNSGARVQIPPSPFDLITCYIADYQVNLDK